MPLFFSCHLPACSAGSYGAEEVCVIALLALLDFEII